MLMDARRPAPDGTLRGRPARPSRSPVAPWRAMPCRRRRCTPCADRCGGPVRRGRPAPPLTPPPRRN